MGGPAENHIVALGKLAGTCNKYLKKGRQVYVGGGVSALASSKQVVREIRNLIGPDSAHTVEGLIVNVSAPRSGVLPSAVSLLTMLVGASGVFGQLRTSLNQIWEVTTPASSAVGAAAQQRLASCAVIPAALLGRPRGHRPSGMRADR